MIMLHNGENGQKSKENTKPNNFIATQASFHLIAFFFVSYLLVTFNQLQIKSVIKSLSYPSLCKITLSSKLPLLPELRL